MGRLFGERNLGNRQISAFKPTGEEENFSLMCFTFQEKVNMPEGFLFLHKQIIHFCMWGCDFGKRVARLPKSEG